MTRVSRLSPPLCACPRCCGCSERGHTPAWLCWHTAVAAAPQTCNHKRLHSFFVLVHSPLPLLLAWLLRQERGHGARTVTHDWARRQHPAVPVTCSGVLAVACTQTCQRSYSWHTDSCVSLLPTCLGLGWTLGCDTQGHLGAALHYITTGQLAPRTLRPSLQGVFTQVPEEHAHCSVRGSKPQSLRDAWRPHWKSNTWQQTSKAGTPATRPCPRQGFYPQHPALPGVVPKQSQQETLSNNGSAPQIYVIYLLALILTKP